MLGSLSHFMQFDGTQVGGRFPVGTGAKFTTFTVPELVLVVTGVIVVDVIMVAHPKLEGPVQNVHPEAHAKHIFRLNFYESNLYLGSYNIQVSIYKSFCQSFYSGIHHIMCSYLV